MSQQQWSARACPTFRRELADAYQARADRIRAMTGPHLPDWMLADGQRTIDADERAAWELRGIDLYWITGEMARLAMDAALDMPEFDARQLASPHGMIFFQRPLPAIQSQPCEIYTDARTVQTWQGDAQVWAVSWHPRQDRVAVTAYTRASDIPGPVVPGADLQPILFMLADTLRPVTLGDLDLRTDQGARVDKRALGILALLGSASVMMMTPTVAERRSLDARTGRAPRPSGKPADLVTTVDLRTMRYVATSEGETDAAGRVYTRRWIVRGHWTHQAYGPGRAERRLQYIEPYIKGPKDAPLVATEKVMVWRR